MKVTNVIKHLIKVFVPDQTEDKIEIFKGKTASSGLIFTGSRGGTIFNYKNSESLESGVIYKNKKFITYTNLDENNLALKTLIPWQKRLLIIIATAFFIGLFISFKFVLTLLITIITLIYFADLVFSVIVLYKILNQSAEINVTENEISNINEANLPVYTILCPLYKESEVVGQFVKSIESLDWPKDKMEALLLLEEDRFRGPEKLASLIKELFFLMN